MARETQGDALQALGIWGPGLRRELLAWCVGLDTLNFSAGAHGLGPTACQHSAAMRKEQQVRNLVDSLLRFSRSKKRNCHRRRRRNGNLEKWESVGLHAAEMSGRVGDGNRDRDLLDKGSSRSQAPL